MKVTQQKYKYTTFWCKYLKGKDYLADPGTDGMIILIGFKWLLGSLKLKQFLD
jgi:hypothetical protein